MSQKPKHEGKSYLERIRFPELLRRDVIWNYITNVRFVVLLVITILLLGLVSYLNIPRRLNPEIKIPIVTVMTVLPGASSEDIESLVTIPLETNLQSIKGVDSLTSNSSDNVSIISLQFTSGTEPEKAKTDTQSAIDSVTELPTDAQTPIVRALDFEDVPFWTFALRSNSGDIASLMRFAETLKKNIEGVSKVDRVLVSGFEEQEIVVAVRPEKVREYNLNPMQLSAIVRSSILSYPAGTLDTGTHAFALAIDPLVTSVSDIRALRLTVGGTTVRLGDIATVSERSKFGQAFSYIADARNEPERVVTFNVYKTSSSNIDEAEKATHTAIDQTLAPYKDRFTIRTVLNTAEQITDQFTELLGEFQSTIILVFLCLFIFLGFRQAVISSVTVPLTFLSAFIFMRYFGMSINFLSLFAFLLSLGLLIDDTIVVVSAMTSYFKSGKFTAAETGRVVWRDTIIPIWSTTITTIWSFVPLLLASGIIGEFIKPIPIVVTVTMISSTAIAVLITLPFMIVLLKPVIPTRVVTLAKLLLFVASIGIIIGVLKSNPFMVIVAILYLVAVWIWRIVGKPITAGVRSRLASSTTVSVTENLISKYANHGVLDIEWVAERYHRLISRILASPRARKITLAAIVIYAVWAFALVPLGLVKNEFFPKTDEDMAFVNLDLPAGTNLETTTVEALAVLSQIRRTDDVEFVALDVGQVIDFQTGGASSGTNVAQFTLHLPENRKRTSIEIAEALRRDLSNYTPGTLSVVEATGGPPAGADLSIQLSGDDLTDLNRYADTIKGHLAEVPGVTNPKKSINPGTSKLVFVPNEDAMSLYGVPVDTIGLWLRMFASGFTLADVKFDKSARTKEDIVFSLSGGGESPEMIGSLTIPTQSDSVPLLALGKLVPKTNPTAITRENGKRTISVNAGVRPGYNVTEKNKELEAFADTIKLPTGYTWQTGGVNEENTKSVQSILQAMALAFILILVTMVIQFQSYRQAVIVLLVIPLAVSSVFAVFALTGTPLSFPALIGVLSLFGIVVTNSMFIVDKINLNLKEGMPFSEAIADAGASRMEPIILTKLCTVLGLLPITLSNPLWQGLGGAIISGILLASSIMLLFIPVVYYEWFNGDTSGVDRL